MDQIKNQLDELVRRLDRRISQASSRSNRFALLTLALLFVALLVIAAFANRYIMTIDNRLHNLETTVKSRSVSEQTQQSQPASSEAVISLDKRITSLENLQEAMASTSRGALEQMNYVFTIVAAFFGLFALFFAYRQAKADTTREEHDEEMRGLVASFQHNITTISSLISTLEQSYDYRKQIEAQLNLISERAKVLESHKAEGEANILNLISELNEEAVKLFPADIDRANLGLEENRRKMEDFANKLTGLERIRKVEDALNPFCYYIRGLSYAGIYQYDLASKDFEIAYRKGRADRAQPKLENFPAHYRDKIKELVNKMLVTCSYFQGVSYKNVGRYPESRNKFQEALNEDPRHLQSKTYLLQVMYFDIKNVSFETIEKEYEKTIQEFETLKKNPEFDQDKLKRAYNILKINQGSMYLKKAFYYPESNKIYEKYENPHKAIESFWEAYKNIENDLAMFALAQAMENVGSAEWRRYTPQEFYQKTMDTVKRRVAEDLDRLYSVMLYYMLAICARKANAGGDSSGVFLAQARHSLKEIPSYVTCYSPISRLRLFRNEILEEMDVFEKTF